MKDDLQKKLIKYGFNIQEAIEDSEDEASGVEDVEFEGCCGASIYYGFPQIEFDSLIHGVKHYWETCVEDYLEWHSTDKKPKSPTDKQFKDLILASVRNQTRVNLRTGHLFFVILSEPQKWCSQFLTPQGFRLVSDKTVNANTGNRLYVYLYDAMTRPKPMKKRFFGAPSRVRRTSLM